MFNPSKKITTKDIQELYYITDIDNVPSILDKGILSHNDAQDIPHTDISNKTIQSLRKDKAIQLDDKHKTTLPLWSFVCLFAQPHNAMMYVSRGKHICVLRIDKAILERDDIYISDRNASCHNASFSQAKNWALTNKTARCLYSRHSLPYSTNTIDPNDYKSIRQLEILCPKKVAKEFILGFFAKQKEDMEVLLDIVKDKLLSLSVTMNANIFFLGKSLRLNTFTPITKHTISVKDSENINTKDDHDENTIILGFSSFSI